MANNDAPFGCTPIGQNGGAYNGQVDLMHVTAAAADVIAVGDLVKLAAGSTAEGIPLAEIVAAGDTVCGIVVGIDWQDGTYDDLPNYKPAAVAANIYVATDPNLRFIIQDDGSGTVDATTMVNSNADIATYVAANATTGRSQIELSSTSAAATSTLDLHIHRLYPTADNEIGANAIWECSFNIHQYGSVGVTAA
jgi:hypothetical protein